MKFGANERLKELEALLSKRRDNPQNNRINNKMIPVAVAQSSPRICRQYSNSPTLYTYKCNKHNFKSGFAPPGANEN
jgi:hypothetical protein